MTSCILAAMDSTPEKDESRQGDCVAKARGRRRDPEGHRAAILDGARAAFAERGFARATIRDIARRAGVTHGLVIRHFGSKELLFLAAVPGGDDLDNSVPGDRAGLPGRLARAYVGRASRAGGHDPLVAMIRGAASDEEAAKKLFLAMRERSADVYTEVVGTPDTEVRVDLAASLLIGATFTRYVLTSGPLAGMDDDTLIAYLTRSLSGILLGPPAP
ncbi:MAG: hypothetical protein QOF98_1690 [Streptomyces sp.]|nr:hypothetical protein [Streptomyces sp.]